LLRAYATLTEDKHHLNIHDCAEAAPYITRHYHLDDQYSPTVRHSITAIPQHLCREPIRSVYQYPFEQVGIRSGRNGLLHVTANDAPAPGEISPIGDSRLFYDLRQVEQDALQFGITLQDGRQSGTMAATNIYENI